jgi:hypothetical protein
MALQGFWQDMARDLSGKGQFPLSRALTNRVWNRLPAGRNRAQHR